MFKTIYSTKSLRLRVCPPGKYKKNSELYYRVNTITKKNSQ